MFMFGQLLLAQANRGGMGLLCTLVLFKGGLPFFQPRRSSLKLILPSRDIATPHIVVAQPLLVVLVHSCVGYRRHAKSPVSTDEQVCSHGT